ncbi:MAG: ThiF family adenylyltransferase [Deltaproteobacteria bacterium]|nr:ThiF family adenylyltransferase [Deltaproteobacteria bacterium]
MLPRPLHDTAETALPLAGLEKRLAEKSVLLVGAGGLGSPAAMLLAASGVGRLGIVDSDVVDRSNLQRQILHKDWLVGRPKVESARQMLTRLRPDLTVDTHNLWLNASNIGGIINAYDVVIEGSDNFATKFLVNDACVIAEKPFVIAGILRFHGQLMTVLPHRSGCYRCLFEAPPPPGEVPGCSEAGVLGVVAGLMGALQATEAVKLLLGMGQPLAGRLLTWDALRASFREVPVPRNPNCAVCGESPTIREPRDSELHCEVLAARMGETAT